MEVVEDMKLGKLVKQNGFTQHCVFGPGLIKIRWIVGALGFVRNITKNFFAVVDFKWWRALLGLLAMAFFFLLPYTGAGLAPVLCKVGFFLGIAVIFLLYCGHMFLLI